jgi:glucose-6-phosphate isomerase
MSWERYKKYNFLFPEIGLALDISRLDFPDSFFDDMEPKLTAAFESMRKLEEGAISNPDEDRMVGHYWLRNAELAPTAEITNEINETKNNILSFAEQIHFGKIRGAGGLFKNILVIGIGGSALGPQFIAKALGRPGIDRCRIHFFDNTDPDGMDYVLSKLEGHLSETLCIVISKSGGTKETRNGMLEAKAAYKRAGLDFSSHAIAITGQNSQLDEVAVSEGWIERFPMWDWVGGRTSILAAVGLVPAALQGIDVEQILAGARAMDNLTRLPDLHKNPAALLALSWFYATDGNGSKDMVVLPYKDRLLLFSRYLQQLIMESLGKEFDLDGNLVNQGIAVYGNKGSTDQHAYVQQLRDGVSNFFATFIEVLLDREAESLEVEEGLTSGDYLHGFLLGTRDALSEKKRESITITIEEISTHTVGMLIALYERAVGLYASLININAYHQPGVEAGKEAATSALKLKETIMNQIKAFPETRFTAESMAASLEMPNETERIYKLLKHLASNPDKEVYLKIVTPWHESTFQHLAH